MTEEFDVDLVEVAVTEEFDVDLDEVVEHLRAAGLDAYITDGGGANAALLYAGRPADGPGWPLLIGPAAYTGPGHIWPRAGTDELVIGPPDDETGEATFTVPAGTTTPALVEMIINMASGRPADAPALLRWEGALDDECTAVRARSQVDDGRNDLWYVAGTQTRRDGRWALYLIDEDEATGGPERAAQQLGDFDDVDAAQAAAQRYEDQQGGYEPETDDAGR